eukprot:2389520-Pyramimonas_sp.AAC.1
MKTSRGLTISAPSLRPSTPTSERASEFGPMSGFALDLGAGRGLNVPAQRHEAMWLRDREQPLLLIGSPRCAALTPLLHFRTAREETM